MHDSVRMKKVQTSKKLKHHVLNKTTTESQWTVKQKFSVPSPQHLESARTEYSLCEWICLPSCLSTLPFSGSLQKFLLLPCILFTKGQLKNSFTWHRKYSGRIYTKLVSVVNGGERKWEVVRGDIFYFLYFYMISIIKIQWMIMLMIIIL